MATRGSLHADFRVLIVDNDSDTLELDELLFRSEGADVRVARDGRTALECAGDWLPSVLVTELYLPDMTSFVLVGAMRSRSPPGSLLKVVAATSRTRQRDRMLASEAGFDAFFAKPVDLEALLRAVMGTPLRTRRMGGSSD
jgi:DNA-binding response OmpR family regulator